MPSSRDEEGYLLMVSATAGTSARRTMFSRPRYLMLGSRTLMNFPSNDTPAGFANAHTSEDAACLTQSGELMQRGD